MVAPATSEDVKKWASPYTAAVSARSPQESDELMDFALATGLENLEKLLMARLPDIYARSGYGGTFDSFLVRSGFSYTDLDSVLDKIVDVAVLKWSHISATLVALYNRLIAHDSAAYGSEVPIYIEQRNHWDKKLKEYFALEWQLLRLDLNDDDVVSDFERPRTQNSFMRV